MPIRSSGSDFPYAGFVRPIRLAVSAALLGLCLATAQTVQLQGALQDKYSGDPIGDAEVTLMVLGLRTTTDSAGRFEIRQVPTRLGAEQPNRPLVRPYRGGLAFSNPEPATITVRVHDAQGKLPTRSSRARLEAGEWTFHPGRLSQGLYFLSLEMPGFKAAVRLPILENVHPGSAVPGFARAAAAGTSALAKAAGAAIDSLRITKAGYFSGIEPLLSLNQTGMIVQLKDSGSTQSVLTGLTLADATFQPPFQSGRLAYWAAVRESVQSTAAAFSTGKAKPNLVLVGSDAVLPSPTSPMPLAFGMNILDIRSTSQDGSSSTIYSIQIHRARDTVSSLRDLRIGESAGALFPDFQSHVLAYKTQIDRSAAFTTLNASWDEPLAAVRINGSLQAEAPSTQTIGLPTDLDSIRATVEVKSPDGLHVSIYTVDFLREPPPPPQPADSSGLASVKTSLNASLFPAWSPILTAYRLDMQDTASTLQITYTPKSPTAFIRAGSNDWQQGTVIENLPFKGSPLYFNHPVTVRNGTDTTRYTFTIATVLSKETGLSQMTAFPRGSGPSFQSATMNEWTLIFGTQDSVVELKPVTASQQAKLVFGGQTVAYNSTIRIPLKPGNNRFFFTVTSQEGTLTRTYFLNFGRMKPKSAVTPPTIAGPDQGFILSPYAYTFKPSSDTCLQGMSFFSRIEWGDGSWQQQGGGSSIPSPFPFGTQAWRTPGTFTVKAVNFCANTYLTLPGDTSAPLLVRIRDTTNGGKVRSISGPRMASETWSPDTLYKVTGNTLFETGTTLTILPGTTILFPTPPTSSIPAYYIAINGGLSAVGTASDSIRFEGPGTVRLKWQGPLAYNPDGSYLAGPRFEYVTFQAGASPYLDETGGYGFYMKNSRVPLVTAEFSKYARGSYIEHCRFGDLANVRMDNSRILNSYFNLLSVNASGSATLTVTKCDIRTLNLGYYSSNSPLVQISGNTIGRVQGGWYAVEMHGNNILGIPLGSGRLLSYNAMGASAVNLRDNYWGEDATAEMIAKGSNQNITFINDYFDDVAMGKVDYSAWRTAPVANANPDWGNP